MDESLSSVHGRELISNTFEEGLDAAMSAVCSGDSIAGTYEVELQMKVEAILSPRGAMSLFVSLVLSSLRRDLPLSGRDVSGDPLDEVGRVLGLNSLDLLLDLLHGNLSSEVASNSEVSLIVS